MPPQIATQINQSSCRHRFVSFGPFLERCVHCNKVIDPEW